MHSESRIASEVTEDGGMRWDVAYILASRRGGVEGSWRKILGINYILR